MGKNCVAYWKHAQIEMGFVRKNRQLFFGLERNQKRNWKKYIISQVCIFKQTVRKEAILGVSANFSI